MLRHIAAVLGQPPEDVGVAAGGGESLGTAGITLNYDRGAQTNGGAQRIKGFYSVSRAG